MRLISILAAVALAVSTSHPAVAEIGCPSGARPLLKTLTYRIPIPNEMRQSVLICTDGTVLASHFSGLAGGVLPYGAFIVRGKAEPGALSDLRLALNAGRIGFQQDCTFVPSGPRRHEELVEWFGAGTRKNLFRMIAVDENLPTCARETVEFWLAKMVVEGSIWSSTGLEVVAFP